MKIECPHCKSIYNVDDDKIPHTGIHVTCRKCNIRFFINSQTNNVQNEKDKCLKCGFDRTDGEESCPKCGIVYKKFKIRKPDDGTLPTPEDKNRQPSDKQSEPARKMAIMALLIILPLVFILIFVKSKFNPPTSSANIPDKILTKLKKNTVLIIVEAGGKSKSGSGFIVHKDGKSGLVVTNTHVIFPKKPEDKIAVVLNSGSAEASISKAEVLGMNLNADIALLKIISDNIPDPIQISQTPEVSETQEVFILGFPFGTMLSTNRETPAISISKGIVSSKRRDENDQIFLIQIDGGINKGNSGGPIVTKDGELIGVAVAAIKETNIGFAIPERKVRAMLDGTLTNIGLSPDAEQDDIVITAERIDPFDHIGNSSLLIVPEKDVVISKALDSNGKWKCISSGSENKGLAFTHAGDIKLSTAIPSERLKNSDSYYAQIILKTKGFPSSVIYQPPFGIRIAKGNGKMFSGANDIRLIGPDVAPKQSEYHAKPSVPEKGAIPSEPPALSDDSSSKKSEELSDSVEIIKTPSPIEDIVLAGGGKYLIFRLTQEPRLGIFDVSENVWRKMIRIPDPDFHIAANMDKILIGMTGRNRLLRIDLETLKEDLAAEVPDGSQIQAMAVGWDSSDTPLVLMTTGGFLFVDVDTLREMQFEWTGQKLYTDHRETYRLRASANGKTFAFWGTHFSPEGVNLMLLFERQIRFLREHETAGYLAPSPKGDLIYTNLKGLYNSGLKITGSPKLAGNHLFPGTDDKYFLTVNYSGKQPSLSIRNVENHLAVMSLNNLTEMKNDFHPMGFHRNMLSEEKRFHFFADKNKLITIPFSDDKIVIRHIRNTDMEEKIGDS